MSLHLSLSDRALCGATDGDFIDLKYIVQHKWKTRLSMFLCGCRECGAELREVMKTARQIR